MKDSIFNADSDVESEDEAVVIVQGKIQNLCTQETYCWIYSP